MNVGEVIAQALVAIVIPFMVRRWGLRVTHLINVWLGAAGLISFLVIRDPQLLAASVLGFLLRTFMGGAPAYALVVVGASVFIAGVAVLRVQEPVGSSACPEASAPSRAWRARNLCVVTGLTAFPPRLTKAVLDAESDWSLVLAA